MEIKKTSIASTLLKIIALAIIGQFTYSKFPIPVVLLALFLITLIFFITLYKKDFFGFLMQLFICNHYTYGYEIGGTFNFVASVALIAYLLRYGNEFFANITLQKNTVFLILGLGIIQVLCLIGGSTSTGLKISSTICFLNFFFLFYYCSKVNLDAQKYIQFIYITGIFFLYMFVNAINQRYDYFVSPVDFFPNVGPNAEWELGIPRAAGTLGNFEYYAEYSISIIAICLPGVLSGSFRAVSKRFFLFSIGLCGLGVLAIVLSGTRSSILLLPFLVLLTIVFLYRRLSIKIVLIGASAVALFFVINTIHTIVDFSIFTKRSEEVDMKHVSLKSILSGKDMNRGEIFEYGFKKIEKNRGLLGSGYFTNRRMYIVAHFDKVRPDEIPDYHNLYMSAVVLWGYLGAIMFLSLFFISMYRGFKLYFKLKKHQFFLVDFLLGFNLLFMFLMINQFKIQFIRDANYFMLILILLSIYNSLIYLLSQKIVVIPTENLKAYENSSITRHI